MTALDGNPLYMLAFDHRSSFSRDLLSIPGAPTPEQAARVADRIEAGMVYINLVLADSPELPFGGVKSSGTARELGLLAADEFVNKKVIRTAG